MLWGQPLSLAKLHSTAGRLDLTVASNAELLQVAALPGCYGERMNDSQRFFPALLTVTALALCGAGLHAQSAAATAAADKASSPMKQFVIIFRQGLRQLTEAELKKRTEETRAWARHQNAVGHKLDPHILAPEGHRIGPDGADGPIPATDAGTVTALLFLEARDLTQAVEVARAHPATRYGASVEVRPWAPPPPAASP